MQIVISIGQGLHPLLCMFVPHPNTWDSLKPGLCLTDFLFISLLLLLTSVSPLPFPIFCLFLQCCPVFWVLSLSLCLPHSSALIISAASFGSSIPQSLKTLLASPAIFPSSFSMSQISLHCGGFPGEQHNPWSSHQHLYTPIIQH